MKKNISFVPTGPSYLPLALQVLISISSAHYVVTYGQTKPVWVIMHQANYYLALSFSILYSFVLIQLVHRITRRLDLIYSWIFYPLKRAAFQFAFGFFLVLSINFFLVWVYFALFGKDLSESGYLTNEFHTVAWMLASLNFLYFAWYFAANFFKLNSEHSKHPSDPLSLKLNATLGTKRFLIEVDDIICLTREDHAGYMYLKDGRKLNMDYRMSDLETLLTGRSFFQINRSVMVSLKEVVAYQSIKNVQAQLTLKSALDAEVSLTVSRSRYKKFRRAIGSAASTELPSKSSFLSSVVPLFITTNFLLF